jgi:hypothetical protein
MTITTAAITAKSGELELAGAGIDVDGDRGGAGATGHTETCTTQLNGKKRNQNQIEIVMSIVRVIGHRKDAVIDITERQQALRGETIVEVGFTTPLIFGTYSERKRRTNRRRMRTPCWSQEWPCTACRPER